MNDEKVIIIKVYAKELKIPTFAKYQELLNDAVQNNWDYEEFLYKLITREKEQRQQNMRKKRIKSAEFPLIKTLDEFDFTQLKYVKPEVIRHLSGCEYIDKHENIIMMGNPGTGKTHLAIALGIMACTKGYKVKFTTAIALVNQLIEAQQTYKLNKILKQLQKTDLLIIDDLSYLSFSRPQAELLFQVISERNERKSTIITSNTEFSKWTDIFVEPNMTAALIDRLTHHSYILNMNGESYRLKQHKKRVS